MDRDRCARIARHRRCSTGGESASPPDALSSSRAGAGGAAPAGTLQFASAFAPDTHLEPLGQSSHRLAGTDGVTGYSWDADLPGRSATFEYVVGAEPAGDYVTTRIETMPGPDGSPSDVLYQEIRADQGGPQPQSRNSLLLTGPGLDQGYVRYWLMLQDDLFDAWDPTDHWRMVMEWKEPHPDGCERDANYRFHVQIMGVQGVPRWVLRGEKVCPNAEELWRVVSDAPILLGEWFLLEVFWRYGDASSGRLWAAINGVELGDYRGLNQHPDNPMGMERWYPFKEYQHISTWSARARQWIDDVEIWSDFPGAR